MDIKKQEIEPQKEIIVLYRCDRKKCEKCCYPECKYTRDISHAVSFNAECEDDDFKYYFEK